MHVCMYVYLTSLCIFGHFVIYSCCYLHGAQFCYVQIESFKQVTQNLTPYELTLENYI
jgi:hypothetical protein